MQFFRTELGFTLEMCWFSAEKLWDSSPGNFYIFRAKKYEYLIFELKNHCKFDL